MSRSGRAAPPERTRSEQDAAGPLSSEEAASLLGPYLSPERGLAPTGVILAVSGGPDSVALMRLAGRLLGRGGALPVTAATVDHGLRPDSAAEARQVEAWARDCSLPHRTLTWTGAKPRTGLQEAAREARYGLLAGLARELGASHVLTAHTRDDQAETVLMRLVRGSGIEGLAAMRPETPRGGVTLARPFLDLRKARLQATCAAAGWPCLQDPSNADPRFARARLRRLMPVLEGEGLTAERLAALARRAARAEDALGLQAERALAAARLGPHQGRLELDARRLAAEPDAVLLRLLSRAIVEVAGEAAPPVRLERWEARILGELRPALARGEGLRLTLGGALLDLRPDGRLVLRREPPRRPPGVPGGRDEKR